MKVLFVKRLYGPIGGSESLTYHLATGLAARGHDVRAACVWRPDGEQPRYRADWFSPVAYEDHRVFWDRGVEVIQVRPRGGMLGAIVDWTAFLDLMRREVLEGYAADRDIVHNVGRESIESAIEVGARVGAGVVLTPLPHVGQLHGGDTPTDVANYRMADAIIAMTEWERRWYARHGIDITNVVTTGAGVDRRADGDPREFRRRYGVPEDAPIVLFIGRKERYKGYIQVLDATELVWRQFPETRFVFIGLPGWYSTFFDDFARYRDERILDLENAPPEVKRHALAACDVFTMPSRWESFGMSYLEAWAYGKPVVACDIPTSRELVTDGIDGLLVPQRATRLGEAFLRLLRDPDLRARMGEAGRGKVRLFSWDRVLDRTEEAYRVALARRVRSLERVAS